MTQVLRCYFVDSHDRVKRIPVPHYRRLLAGDLELAAFAGEAVRFAEMTLWLDEDRIIARALIWFPLVHFDDEGRRDLEKRRQEMNLVMREVESSTEGHWSELYRAERFAAFRWLAPQHILEQLHAFLPHHPTEASTPFHKNNLSS